jgi:hypothetical protein
MTSTPCLPMTDVGLHMLEVSASASHTGFSSIISLQMNWVRLLMVRRFLLRILENKLGLFVYKQYAEAEGVQGVPRCTLVTLQRQIEWCFEGKADCLDSFSVARRSVFKGLYYTGPKYHVQKNPAQFEFPILGKYNFL